jgi:cobalt-zinc-cadmium efflux system membrane fusion protein
MTFSIREFCLDGPRRPILQAAAILAAALALAGCNKVASANKEEESASRAPSNPLEIHADEAMMQRIKIGEPRMAQVGGSLIVAARVDVDETRVGRVGAPVMGRITELDVREGQQVTRGQMIAMLNSTGLSDAQLSLLKAISQQQLAQRAVERAEQLLNAGVIGTAELRRREAELTQANADIAASRDQLRILGLPQDALENLERTRSINSTLRITANMDGTVLQRHIAIGEVIEPADTLVEIADLGNLWLIADIPEQSAGNVVAGQSVDAEIAALPGQQIHGTLSFVSATVNPETRTVRARMDLPNPNRKYKPAMLATMTIHDPTQQKLVVPSAAVVRDDGKEMVFVETAPGDYMLHEVTLGEERGGNRVVIDGLQPGQRIIVDGAFHLNNERIRLVIQGV